MTRGSLDTETGTQGERHVKMGVMLPHAMLERSRSASVGARPCQHIDLGLLAPRTGGR